MSVVCLTLVFFLVGNVLRKTVNRERDSYYLADGVKLFSQETWRMFMGEAGRYMVGKYAKDVTDYYCMASELDNHCVRESACHSIAEMAEKVTTVQGGKLYRIVSYFVVLLCGLRCNDVEYHVLRLGAALVLSSCLSDLSQYVQYRRRANSHFL